MELNEQKISILTIRGATRAAADVTNIFESNFLTLSGALKGGSVSKYLYNEKKISI